jgi:hypothetical protein
MARSSKVTSDDKVESIPFELELPTALQIEPRWAIQLSPNKAAHIYPYEVIQEGDNHTSYEVVIVNTATGATNSHQYRSYHSFRHLHNLKQYLIDTSREFNIKKRTRRTTEVDESDED